MLRFLLDALDSNTAVSDAPNSGGGGAFNYSCYRRAAGALQGKLMNETRCRGCGAVSAVAEPFSEITVALPDCAPNVSLIDGAPSVASLLGASLIEAQALDGLYDCAHCAAKSPLAEAVSPIEARQRADRRTVLVEAPQHLVSTAVSSCRDLKATPYL